MSIEQIMVAFASRQVGMSMFPSRYSRSLPLFSSSVYISSQLCNEIVIILLLNAYTQTHTHSLYYTGSATTAVLTFFPSINTQVLTTGYWPAYMTIESHLPAVRMKNDIHIKH